MDQPRRRSGRPGWTTALALALALVLGATDPAVASATFEGQGRVTAVDPGRKTVTIEHAGIPGLLPAARSEFPVAGVGVIRGVRPGDRVRFTLTAAEESHGLLTVASLAPEAAANVGWPDRLLGIVGAVLALLALVVAVAVGVILWRTLQILHRRVVALDHEAGMLRGLVSDTQDGVRQIARALEDVATTLRVAYIRDLRHRLVAASPPAAAGVSSGRAPVDPAGALVVVQQGRGDLFHAVKSGAVGPGCAVIWDRRRGERRAIGRRPVSHERRRGERRASPPETWTRLGFHLVPVSPEAPRGPRPLRPASGERGAAH
jgi:Cu/Ag efflux protein CusF